LSMMPRLHRARPVIAMMLVTLLPGCTVTFGASGPSSPMVVTSDQAITVASFDFPESVLLAEIYAQALEAGGFAVKRALNLGPRELVEPALERGLVEFVPEYLGTALDFLSGGERKAVADTEVTRQKLVQAFGAVGVDVLASSPAQDANALAVTIETAARYRLSAISDLGPVAKDFVLGGPPECPSRPLCLPGLRETYGLTFKRFAPLDAGGPLTAAALAARQVDVAVLFTTDGDIPARGFVVLQDDGRLQPAENVTPVVLREVVTRFGPRLTSLVNTVSANLTTTALAELNRRLSLGSSPAALARQWLRTAGLSGG
jgi:osmoprotectant transport system substrate-binding protein